MSEKKQPKKRGRKPKPKNQKKKNLLQKKEVENLKVVKLLIKNQINTELQSK